MILNITMICLVLLMVGVVVVNIIINQVQEDTADTALTIGRMAAQTPAVQQAILSEKPSEVLQPLSESWRISSGAAFVIIANMDQIRLSHPIPENVGTPLSNLYREPVLRGQEYIYVGRGSLPTSVRANVPIYNIDGTAQIGFASVGFYLDSVYHDALGKFTPMLYLFLIAFVFGIGGSVIVARNIKNSIFGLEPYEIATILKERVATLESIREGVVAVDKHGVIRLLNNEAANILGVSREWASGRHINTILPQSKLEAVIGKAESVYDEEQRVGDSVILANSVPIMVDNKVVGAVISFRDRTEMNRLAEELTGVHQFVDVLRAQAHEFKNKLHTIAGLIQLQRYQEALNFTVDSGSGRQELADRLSVRIKDSIVYGLLLGKASHMREMGVEFEIAQDTVLTTLPGNLTSGDLVLIIGNLLENALDALAGVEDKRIVISVVQCDEVLKIRVYNSGPWISDELSAKIYQRGFSTKKGTGGLGLALISEKLKLVSGVIEHGNVPSGGVEFIVCLPY